MVRFIFFSCLLLLAGCRATKVTPEPPVVVVEKRINSEEFTWIVMDLNQKWKHERHLFLEDSNVFYGQYVNALRFDFSTMLILDVKEARDLIVDVTEEILKAINTNPLITDDLKYYPFTANNLEIYISFDSFYGRYVDPYKVGRIDLENGDVYIWADDVKDKLLYYWHYREEPYFKSREIRYMEKAAEEKYERENMTPPSPLEGIMKMQRPHKTS